MLQLLAGLHLLQRFLLQTVAAVMSCMQNYPAVDKYVEALLEARKGKNMTADAARDAITNDVNMFGVMMVAEGDAHGMVSGAMHTTAATIRPAMQVRAMMSVAAFGVLWALAISIYL